MRQRAGIACRARTWHYALVRGAPIRIVYAVPPPPDWRYRVRQILHVLVKIQLSELRPSLFVFNRAGVSYFLFSVQNEAEAREKATRLDGELDSLSLEKFLARYQIPSEFVDAIEPLPRRRNRIQPLL